MKRLRVLFHAVFCYGATSSLYGSCVVCNKCGVVCTVLTQQELRERLS